MYPNQLSFWVINSGDVGILAPENSFFFLSKKTHDIGVRQ